MKTREEAEDSEAMDPLKPTVEEEASQAFIKRLYSDWTPEDQAALEIQLETNPEFAAAWRRTEKAWTALDAHAGSPELMAYRAEAIAELRRANSERWYKGAGWTWRSSRIRIAAALAGLALLGGLWQVSPYGYRAGTYRTAIGEQRLVELADHSRITMDAVTRLVVSFSADSRTVHLLAGQAEFSVARDPSRPFKVIAGDRTVVAIGTVFIVEYADRATHVAMLEGKVAVIPGDNLVNRTGVSLRTPVASASELGVGDELSVGHDGTEVVNHNADLAAATAWRQGKVIFRDQPLAQAIERMNRYSHLQLKIDDARLAAQRISGVFEAGDTRGFVNALERYLMVTADYSGSGVVGLKPR